MKINKVMNNYAGVAGVPASTAMPSARLMKEEASLPEASDTVDPVIFPASDRFKHMLKLIARDNKELYNRIIGME